MDRVRFYVQTTSDSGLDYEVSLDTRQLLACQNPFEALYNKDKLQFQILHEVDKLGMTLIACTLLSIDEHLAQRHTGRVLSLGTHCHRLLERMTGQLRRLTTRSPKDDQKIRLQLGNGSGQEFPGFRLLLKMILHLWSSCETAYLADRTLTVEQIDGSRYNHDEAFMVAEAMMELDDLFQVPLVPHPAHPPLHRRGRGLPRRPLGRPAEDRRAAPLLPLLWNIRSQMTDRWGGANDRVRESIAAVTLDTAISSGQIPWPRPRSLRALTNPSRVSNSARCAPFPAQN